VVIIQIKGGGQQDYNTLGVTRRTVLIVQDKVLRCDSTGIRGQMRLHRTKRTYGISQTKRKDSIRQDQHDRKIRQNKKYSSENAGPRRQMGLYCTGPR
jgi:hypothetical protein